MKYSQDYIHDLESLLYIANQKVQQLSRPYDVELNGREETIRSLQELQSLLGDTEQTVTIKIKTKTLGKRK